ncbi:hypothetical protein, partial [Nocardia sp. CC227C]|uniref:hypothetical protein n=1 Tax=Nocardia sp. CC227C TaxID=3044562 RepID=UPI00278C4F40
APVFQGSDLGYRRVAFALYLERPGGDEGGVGSGFESGAVPGQLSIAVEQILSRGIQHGVCALCLCCFELGQRVLDAVGVEYLGQPEIDRTGELIFAQVDGERLSLLAMAYSAG